MRLGHVLTASFLCLSLLLTGCALQQTAAPVAQPGVRLSGNVHGGQQPIVGAHVYLFAASSTGYGQPSVSLLNAASTGLSDSVGAYVTSDANGGFTITGNYSCTPNTQVYLYALGGDPGAGVNSGAALLAVLGNCPSSGSFLGTLPFIQVNEVTTVAAAYAMAGFATDATHVSSSGTPQALIGIANAFANAANLADISSGSALTTTPAGNGAVPNKTINALANMLAACVNSTGPGSTTCSTLFANALSGGTSGSTPTDTATAIINIAHNPGANVSALSGIPTGTPPFAPSSFSGFGFTLYIKFTGPTISPGANIAIDGSGNVWTFNHPSGSFIVTEMSPTGAILSGPNGYPVGNDVVLPSGSIAIDQSGNAWLTGTSHIYKISSGSVSTFQPDEGSAFNSVAIDAAGNAWINTAASTGNAILVELAPDGTDLHFNSTAQIGKGGLAIDSSGIAWTAGGLLYGTTIATGTNVNVTENDVNDGFGVAIGAAGNEWVMGGAYLGADYLTQFAYNSATQTYDPVNYLAADTRPGAYTLAVDGAGIIWTAPNYFIPPIAAYTTNGSGIVMIGNYGDTNNGFSSGLALDPSGDVWTANSANITEYIGASTPVVTPLSIGTKNNTLATRP